MATLDEEALQALSQEVASLFPPPATPALQPTLLVGAAKITPTGLGGLAGPSASPQGEVLGRRVDAELRVTVRAGDDAALDTAVSDLTRAVLGAERRTLLEKGILRVSVGSLGERVTPPEGSTVTTREVGLKVLYEFLKLPTAPAGTIDRIPLVLESGLESPAEVLLRTEFGPASLATFDVVDDPAATTDAPSTWQYAAAQQRIEQRSAIRGGAGPVQRPGTYLVLKATPPVPPVADLSLGAWMAAGAPGGIGVVFRWVDADNFYFLLLDSSGGGERMLGKKVGGAFQALQEPASVTGAAWFTPGRSYHVRVAARGEEIEAYVDGERILRGRDPSLAGPGRVGLLSRGCDQAFFHALELVRL